MKTIPIKTNKERFFRQFLEVLKSIPPIKNLRPKELDVLAEVMYQNHKYKDYPEEHRLAIIFNPTVRKEMRDKIGIGVDSFNNNISILRKSKILDKNNKLHPFFRGIEFNGKFELTFTEPKLATNSVSTVKIQDDAVTKDKINADIAGLGLSQAVGGELDVNVDNSTLEINSDTLRIKNDGVTTVKILDQNVTTSKINDLAVTTAKINDGAVTTVKVLDNNITNAKLAQMPSLTVKANITGGTANAADVTTASLFGLDTTKWSTTGNAGTTPGTNFIGTTDAQDLVFKLRLS